jgi:exodeoxyribonuclease VII large subunit
VVAGQEEFRARIDRLAGRARSAATRSVERLRTLTHRLAGRPGLAGWPARLALRGRHIAELTHDLGRTGRALVSRRERRYNELRLGLETYDLRRQIGEVRTRLMRGEAALRAAAVRAHTRADGRFRGQAARLESLSPLAVLGRGYAVCWDEDRTRIIRDAGTVHEGDGVRVTLHRGELECTVSRTAGSGKPAADR